MADSICPSTAAPEGQPDGAAVARVEKALHRRGAFTEIMGKVLDFCRQRRLLAEVEDEIASYPEFKYVDQSQAAIVFMLVEAGGLARIDLDRDGNPVDPARLASLDEDAADELVQFCALETTPAGVQVAQAHRPEVRLEELFARTPERNDAYRAILRAASLCTPARWWRTWRRPAAWCGTRPGVPPRPERASRPQTKGASNGGTEVELRKARPHGAEGAGHRLGLGRLSRGG